MGAGIPLNAVIQAVNPTPGRLSAKLLTFLLWGLGFTGPRTEEQLMVEFKVRIEGVSTMLVTGMNMRPKVWVGRMSEYVASKRV